MSQLSSTLPAPTKAYITYGKRVPFEQVNSAESLLGEPDNVEISTNLDLFGSPDNTAQVDYMEIDVHYCQDPFPGLLAVAKHLENTPVLSEITKLCISLHPQNWDNKMDGEELDKHQQDMDMFSASVHRVLPNVVDINFGGVNKNHAARMLYGKVTGGYADQLKVLFGSHAIIVPSNVVFKQLQRAHFTFDGYADFQVPRMNPSSLVKFSIINVPLDFCWLKPFSDGESKTIEFSNLEELEVSYNMSPNKEGMANSTVYSDQGMRLHFPKLENLNIGRMSRQSALLSAAVYPDHIESVEVAASWFEFEYIAEMNLPAAVRVEIGVEHGSDWDSSVFPYINQMLCNAKSSKNIRLDIRNQWLPVVAKDITCLNLNSITIFAPTNADTLVGIIERLPNLTSLSLLDLIPEAVETDISIANIDEHQNERMVPFNTKLSDIILNYSSSKYSVESMVAVIGYLLLCTPTLKRFLAPQTEHEPVMEFVHKFAPLYPHVMDIGFNVKRKDDCPCGCIFGPNDRLYYPNGELAADY